MNHPARSYNLVTEAIAVGERTLEFIHPRSADDLLDEEEFDRDGRIPYWAEIWPSARVLAQRLATLDGRGRSLIELGCGAGLCAAAAAMAGFDVLATDYYTEALEFVRLNAAHNALPEPGTRTVDWRDWPVDIGQFDVVAAADVLYEREYGVLVAQTIARALKADGTAILTDPGRHHARRFPEDCRAAGLHVVSHDQAASSWEGKPVTVDMYTLRHA